MDTSFQLHGRITATSILERKRERDVCTMSTRRRFWTLLNTLALATSWLRIAKALPDGFSHDVIFKEEMMTEIAFSDKDAGHLMFVATKEGIINVYEPGDDYKYKEKTKALDIRDKTCDHKERALGGLELHPDFAENNWLYTYYSFRENDNCEEEGDDGPINRLSRWVFDPSKNTIDEDSEEVLLVTPNTAKGQHNAGKIQFGKDGYLYLSIGDTGVREESQNLSNLIGGMVRLTDDGDIPSDNPFAKDDDGDRCHKTGSTESSKKCLELYAIGLRNPWRFAMDPNTRGDKVRFFVNDVGASHWEEISEGGDDFRDADEFEWEGGLQNFGWPLKEGPCRRGREDEDCGEKKGFIHPVHFYPHQGGGAATAGAFVPNGVWPKEYDDKYLYAEFFHQKIYSFGEEDDCDDECSSRRSKKDPKLFHSGDDIMTMRFGPYVDGKMALYYTVRDGGGLMCQVVCDDCSGVSDDSGDSDDSDDREPTDSPTAAPDSDESNEADEPEDTEDSDDSEPTDSPTATPTAEPTDLVLSSRPEGEGGYPGTLFPWSSGADCPDGFDFCGVLEFCMGRDSPDTTPVYGYRLPCLTDECNCLGVPGPLIRLIPGNKYRLILRNAGTEVTNLHTHGLHIVGDGDGDDVIREVMGGGNCLNYTWDIKADHPGGTNWYHAHHHGISEKQVGGGAYGMLIVEDNTNLDPVLPSWAGNERLLQVAAAVYTDEMFANGRSNEVIDIAAKQWYRLRVSLVDANALPYNFTFGDDGLCDIHKVAQDGVWRSVVPGPQASVWELTGASRADFAIRCNTPNSLVPIFYRDDELVAQIWVGAEKANPYVMEEFIPNRPYSISDMLSETVPDDNRFSVRLGFDYVNDGKWDPMEPIATIGYDQVHEWTLMQTWFHPFHLHLYHMQIATPGGCGAHEEGELYDTIAAPGNCTIRFRTADIGQRCVLHCHVLFHEDNGSMSWVNVTGENMPMNTEQSFEYVCPTGTLPTQGPTGAPTQAPTDHSSCLPGFLGITSKSPLLYKEEFINEEYDVYIRQQGDGNLVVRRGTPENRGEVVWSHGMRGNASSYYTVLKGDSTLATLTGTPGAEGTILWEAGSVHPEGEYYVGIDCNHEFVAVYPGDPNDFRRSSETAVWKSTSRATATSSPTPSPTVCLPGFLGITTESPLLYRQDFINEEYDVFIRQHGDGNLVVRHGTPTNPGEKIWSHDKRGNASSYFTELKSDSNLVTRSGTPDDEGIVLWETNVDSPEGEYFLGIDCNKEFVAIYAGVPNDLRHSSDSSNGPKRELKSSME